jgi:uncharacterized cupin superfamily protein
VHGDRFEAKLGAISARIGAQKLGYKLTVLSPGKIRIGAKTYAVRQGDVIACPPGGPETAHQLINTSDSEEMKYLAVATSMSPEIDSDKVGVLARFPADGDGKPTVMRYIIRDQADMTDYWEGE